MSQESRLKISKSLSGIAKPEGFSKKLKDIHTELSGKRIKDINTNIIYPSISEASRQTGLSIAAISKQCSKLLIGRSYTFRYEDIVCSA